MPNYPVSNEIPIPFKVVFLAADVALFNRLTKHVTAPIENASSERLGHERPLLQRLHVET